MRCPHRRAEKERKKKEQKYILIPGTRGARGPSLCKADRFSFPAPPLARYVRAVRARDRARYGYRRGGQMEYDARRRKEGKRKPWSPSANYREIPGSIKRGPSKSVFCARTRARGWWRRSIFSRPRFFLPLPLFIRAKSRIRALYPFARRSFTLLVLLFYFAGSFILNDDRRS